MSNLVRRVTVSHYVFNVLFPEINQIVKNTITIVWSTRKDIALFYHVYGFVEKIYKKNFPGT